MKTQHSILLYLVICFLAVFSLQVCAQSKTDLEKKKKQAQKDIEFINKLLEETQKKSENSYNNLVVLNKKITVREELINNIYKEIVLLNGKIDKNKTGITALQSEQKRLKGEYAKMIYFAYKNRNSYDRLMFVLASKDFNQAYKRVKYLQQYTEFRKKQVAEIVKNETSLNAIVADLEQQKLEKADLLKNQQSETILLSFEKSQQANMLTKLKTKEAELKKKLAQQMEITKKLQKAIENIIAEEARKAAEKAKKAGTKSSNNNIFELTPEEKLISDNFGANKGVLPWPTERGIITGTFGEHPHPVFNDIKVQNNGIDISTAEGANVRSIFDGEVSKIISIPGANKAILIRHGNYFTLYSNLRDVAVKAGDKVKAKQNIGTVISDSAEDNRTTLHIEIWQESTKLDPVLWLTQKHQ